MPIWAWDAPSYCWMTTRRQWPLSGVVFNWAWVLLFLMTGDEEAARDALDHAMEGNSHVAPLLVGVGRESEVVTAPFVASGSEDEAHLCIQILGEAWERSGLAQMWLYKVLVDMGLVESLDEESEGEPPAAH